MCKIREPLTICRSKNQPLGGRKFFILFHSKKTSIPPPASCWQWVLYYQKLKARMDIHCSGEKDFLCWMFWLSHQSRGNSDDLRFTILHLLPSPPCFSSTVSYLHCSLFLVLFWSPFLICGNGFALPFWALTAHSNDQDDSRWNLLQQRL